MLAPMRFAPARAPSVVLRTCNRRPSRTWAGGSPGALGLPGGKDGPADSSHVVRSVSAGQVLEPIEGGAHRRPETRQRRRWPGSRRRSRLRTALAGRSGSNRHIGQGRPHPLLKTRTMVDRHDRLQSPSRLRPRRLNGCDKAGPSHPRCRRRNHRKAESVACQLASPLTAMAAWLILTPCSRRCLTMRMRAMSPSR